MNDQETGSPNKRVKEDCERLLAAYMDCEQKHKLDARSVCRHLEALTGWCLIREVCPQEVDDLRDCVGVKPGQPIGIPGSAPRQCRGAEMRMMTCLKRQQDLLASQCRGLGHS
eukprot:CAMPEP_0206139938 /NCGR_PEP_ID=MMETSP1473-20131121/7818_1 /ASSEMBLY_ACC=CAM_ASM_001109 /TAXON_ID=1461547 /ORGANISM="Stichococcus sp, Strain RCC1054" /LENGTH=112 /DNA_ID=CAMNT_0053533889 /DNA_START=166 /DNA_END=507 /DNA_ORIENTATION=+